MTTIKAVLKEPEKDSIIYNLNPTLESLQKAVKGRIEIIGFPNLDKVDLIVNEEGKLLGLDPNIYIPEYDDLIVGPLVAVGFDEETGEHKALTEDQIEDVQEYLSSHDSRKFCESDSPEFLIITI